MDSNRHTNHQYHHSHEQEDLSEEANLSPTQLLQLSETHLRLRNFTLSHQYALESQSQLHSLSSQNLYRYATQIATLSNILLSSSSSSSSSLTNHYSVLQLDTFSSPTPTQLSSHHSTLLSLLTPLKPRIPLATEGIELLTKAHFTLSDPTRKAQFDALLGQTVKKIGSFWTFCPYCFYLYEYGKCYEGCCLRCQNGKCRRVFCGVELTSLPPGDVEKGKYFGCFGYFPIGFDPLRKKVESWSPLVGMFPLRRVKSRAHRIDLNHGGGIGGVEYDEEGEEEDEFIEISSESDSPDYRPPKGMKRKSVARKMATRRRGGGNVGVGMEMENGVQEEEGFGVEGEQDGVGVGVDGNDMNVDDDVNFFEDNGEIFVELGQDDAAPAAF